MIIRNLILSINFCFCLSFLGSAAGQEFKKVKIHFYPQRHYIADATHREALIVLVSQAAGLIKLSKLIENNPNLPIFDEVQIVTEEEEILNQLKNNKEDLKKCFKRIKLKDIDNKSVAQFINFLKLSEQGCLYLYGFVDSLNAIRQNSGEQPLNLVPTVPNVKKLMPFITSTDGIKFKRTQNYVRSSLLLPVTFFLSSWLLGAKDLLTPIIHASFVATSNYLLNSFFLSSSRGFKYFNLPIDYAVKVSDYIVFTFRERVVQEQMEYFVKNNPSINEVFLCFGAGHEFQEIQKSQYLEFIDPPEITKDLVQFEEIKEGLEDFIGNHKYLNKKNTFIFSRL